MSIKLKYIPYVVILAFSLVVAIIRWFMIPEWGWLFHTAAYFGQLIFLVAIWHLVKLINDKLETRYPFERGVKKRVFLQFAFSFLLICPIYLLMFLVAKDSLPPFANKQFIAIGSLLLLVMILLLNSGFYFLYFFNQWRQSVEEKAKLQVSAAELEKEKSMMQYHHLKNQVNPHFLFNTFSSIDGLIQSNPQLASEFIRHLSKVYRYVLEHKENEVVRLHTEIQFLQHYISLLKIRYKDGIDVKVELSELGLEQGIVMVTLQMLVDNAIKHNQVSPASPLTIVISDDEGYVSVVNNKQVRKQIELSSKHGLKQLMQLYSYLSPKPVEIIDAAKLFEVKLPLL